MNTPLRYDDSDPNALSFKDKLYYQKFESLLNELSEELTKLTEEKRKLLDENQQLRDQINKSQNSKQNIFVHLTENQKQVMRSEITDLIQRIDNHISNLQ